MKMQNSREKLDYSRSAEVADFFQTYFEAKSGRDLEGATRHFSQDTATYSDVTMG